MWAGKAPAAQAWHGRPAAGEGIAMGPDSMHYTGQPGTEAHIGPASQLWNGMMEPEIRRMMSDWEQKLGPDHPSMAVATASLAALLEDQRRWEEAEELHYKTLSLQEAACGPDHSNVGDALQSLAKCEVALGRLDEAKAHLTRALKLREGDPSKSKLAEVLEALAGLQTLQKKHREASGHLRRALQLREEGQLAGTASAEVPRLLLSLAKALRDSHDITGAEEALLRLVKTCRSMPGSPVDLLAEALVTHGTLALRRNAYQEAETRLREGITLYEKALGVNHPRVAEALSSLALTHARQGTRLDEAEALYQRAIDIQEGYSGARAEQISATFKGYADLLSQTGRHEDAQLLYRHCMNLLGGNVPKRGRASVSSRLGVGLVKLKRLEEAEQQLRLALSLYEEEEGSESLKVAGACENLANLLIQAQKSEDQAIDLLRRSVQIKEKHMSGKGLPASEVIEAISQLGLMLKHCDRYQEGEEICRRADSMRRKTMDPDQLELEAYLRSGDLPQTSPTAQLAHLGAGHPGQQQPQGDALSPRVESVRPASRVFQVDEDILGKSLDFRQWAMNSGHMAEALAAVGGSWKTAAKGGQTANEQRQSLSTKSPLVGHPIAMLKDEQKRSGNKKDGNRIERYPSLDLDDSLTDLIEADILNTSGLSQGTVERPTVRTLMMEEDDILMGSITDNREGDIPWDLSGPQSATTHPNFSHTASGERPEASVDLDCLLQSFMETNRCQTRHPEDSLDALDVMLSSSAVRVPTSTLAGVHARRLSDAPAVSSMSRSGSLGVDELINHLQIEG